MLMTQPYLRLVAAVALGVALSASAQSAPGTASKGKTPEHVTLVPTHPTPQYQTSPSPAPAHPARTTGPLLPESFSGWKQTSAKASKDPADSDASNPALLKEYGFTDQMTAAYERDGRKIQVKAARFQDAGGAYGAFTFYKSPAMIVEKIGDQAASANTRILFYRGNVLVDATLDEVTPMSAAELRELADDLPQPQGPQASLPILPTYLPQDSYVRNSAKYLMGPIGLTDVHAPIPADQVGFDKGAEVALGRYSDNGAQADLVLIMYPTPQIAMERLQAIQAANATNGAASQPTFEIRRSGPIVAIARGEVSPRFARSLVASVNYDPRVTWNEPTFTSPRDNIGNLVVGAFLLIGILFLFAIGVGVAFGGMRLLMKRLFPDRVFDRPQDVEIIRLKLSE